MLRIASLALLAALGPAIPAQDHNPEPELLGRQRPDGSWSAAALPADVSGLHPGLRSDDVMVSSLIVLALLGDGQTIRVGAQHERVANALDWLLELQADDGLLAAEDSPTPLADHAIACLALSEAAYLSGTSRYRIAARAAVGYLENSSLAAGGWSASGEATDALDPRATSWAVMALSSARDAELARRPELIAAAAWHLRCAGLAHEEASVRERGFELLARLFAGESASESPEFETAVAALLAEPVEWRESGEGFDPESFYVRSLLAYQSGGELWKDWERTMKRVQKTMGPAETRRMVVDAEVPGGSLAAWAYSALALEVYFRYARVLGTR